MFSHGGRVGFEAWIETTHDKKRLPIHELIQHDPRKKRDEGRSEAFAECVEGTEFAVHISKLKTCLTPGDWQFELFIDGQSIDLISLSGEMSTIDMRSKLEKEGSIIMNRPLMFTPSITTDDMTKVTSPLRNQKAMGTIAVTVRNGKRGPARYAPSQSLATLSRSPPQMTVEESKHKLGTSIWSGTSISPTNTFADSSSTSAKGEEWAEVDEPMLCYGFTKKSRTTIFYRFVWKYRTIDKLMALKVIPTPPAQPSSAPTKRHRPPTPPKITSDGIKDFLDDEKPGFDIINAQQKRIKYLEEQNLKLNGIVKRGNMAEHDIIDVSDDAEYE